MCYHLYQVYLDRVSTSAGSKIFHIMKNRTFLRLSIAIIVCVIVWILWFLISFDMESMDPDKISELGEADGKLPKRHFPDATKFEIPLIEKQMELPDMEKAVGLTFHNRTFYLNGMPFRIFSGAVHYFRIVPEYWKDRLMKLKACGLNTVETYVAWNLHEPTPGQYNFEGMLDLRKFIQLAGELGLFVILRPGPFICSELEFGGLPGWLLRDPGMRVRSNYPGYVRAVKRYFSKLLPMVKDLQFTEGGPIIMFQVENEYSVYGRDIQHLKLLVYVMKSHGIKELLVTSDFSFRKIIAETPHMDFSKYALPTDNFGSHTGNSFAAIRSCNKHYPVMVMEFWVGWFDTWGSKRALRDIEVVNATLDFILAAGASFNMYMFIGGTNFGFTAGANNHTGFKPMMTSYDYDGILSEAGDITPKYTLVREKLQHFYKSIGIDRLPDVPPNTPKADYGSHEVTEIMEWDVFISLIPISVTDNKVNFMETYTDRNERYNTMGYIVYSFEIGDDTHWNKLPGVQLTGYVKDRLSAILNGEVFYMMDSMKKSEDETDVFLHYNWDQKWQNDPYMYIFNYSDTYDDIFSNPRWLFDFLNKAKDTASKLKAQRAKRPSQRIDLMVENQGRVNFSPLHLNLLDHQRKGLQGPVFRYIFGIMEEWIIKFINFDGEQCELLSRSKTWSNVTEVQKKIQERGEKEKVAPTLYRLYLYVDSKPQDTFVKLEGWTKGVVIVNGFNLGRYWSIGPQKTLYLPGPILHQGRNEILVFEEIKRGKFIKFQDYHELS